MYIYNHKNWLSLENSYFVFKKKEPRKEVVEEKPKRTEEERRKEIENIRAYTSNKVNSELLHNHEKAIDEVFKKGIVKSNIKVYGRFRSFLMDNKNRIILSLVTMFFISVWIGLIFAMWISDNNLNMPTELIVFLANGSLVIGSSLCFFLVES